MMVLNKLLLMLGLMRRSGSIDYTEDSCKKAISSGNSFLIILFEDSSSAVCNRFKVRANDNNIPIISLPYKKYEISRAIGCSDCSVISVNNKGFAESFLNKFYYSTFL